MGAFAKVSFIVIELIRKLVNYRIPVYPPISLENVYLCILIRLLDFPQETLKAY